VDLNGVKINVSYAVPNEIADKIVEYNSQTSKNFGYKLVSRQQVGDDVRMEFSLIYKGFTVSNTFVVHYKDTTIGG